LDRVLRGKKDIDYSELHTRTWKNTGLLEEKHKLW
jgi:hypothetical protein